MTGEEIRGYTDLKSVNIELGHLYKEERELSKQIDKMTLMRFTLQCGFGLGDTVVNPIGQQLIVVYLNDDGFFTGNADGDPDKNGEPLYMADNWKLK